MAFFSVLYNVVIMFMLMACGFLIYKVRIINDTFSNGLTRLLLLFVCPVVVVYAFHIKYDAQLLHGMIVAALSALGAHIFTVFFGFIVFNRLTTDQRHQKVLRFSIVYSNCGYIGIPLLGSVLGQKGVFYASIYIIFFHIFTWTHGVATYSGKASLKSLRKMLLNPNIIAIVIGIIIFSFSITLPPIINDGMKYIFNLNTPLAMLIVGINLAQIKPLSIITDGWAWFGVLVKNFIVPFIAIFILHWTGVSGVLLLACLIPIACPTAGNTVFFAEMYDTDTRFPTRLMSLSTLASIISIPLLVYIVELFHY